MTIRPPSDIETLVRQQAAAVGATVDDYLSQILADAEPPCSAEELAASAAELEIDWCEVRAGQSLSLEEAKAQVLAALSRC